MDYGTGFKIVAVGTALTFRAALFGDAMNHPGPLPDGWTAPTWGITTGSTMTTASLNIPTEPPVAILRSS
jgi:hypothetical protein